MLKLEPRSVIIICAGLRVLTCSRRFHGHTPGSTTHQRCHIAPDRAAPSSVTSLAQAGSRVYWYFSRPRAKGFLEHPSELQNPSICVEFLRLKTRFSSGTGSWFLHVRPSPELVLGTSKMMKNAAYTIVQSKFPIQLYSSGQAVSGRENSVFPCKLFGFFLT